MEQRKEKLKNSIICNNEREVINLLNSGFDPNFDNGWAIRLAARNGRYSIVKMLIQHGACPHSLNEAGASTLQLAVYSNMNWDSDKWTFLMSCCDSSQLADGAAVAIIFNNKPALERILQTCRCNIHIPTTLTGKTIEELAKGYKLQDVLNSTTNQNTTHNAALHPSPRAIRSNRSREMERTTPAEPQANRNLSPSVARFFNLTAGQPSLTPPHSPVGTMFSPTAN